jgi:hypothetical protein
MQIPTSQIECEIGLNLQRMIISKQELVGRRSLIPPYGDDAKRLGCVDEAGASG